MNFYSDHTSICHIHATVKQSDIKSNFEKVSLNRVAEYMNKLNGKKAPGNDNTRYRGAPDLLSRC